MAWDVAGELKPRCVGKGPYQFFSGPRLDQDAVWIVVFHADHLHPAHGMIHVAHVLCSSWRKRAVLKHCCHFFLMGGMCGCHAQVELVQQRALILEYEADGFSCFDINTLRLEKDIAHPDFDGSIRFCGAPRLTDIAFTMVRASHGYRGGKNQGCGNKQRSEFGFHNKSRKWICWERD